MAEFGNYLVEYSFDDGVYVFMLKARSLEEAEARIKRIGAFGRVAGSNATIMPASLGWAAKLLVWWRNFNSKRN